MVFGYENRDKIAGKTFAELIREEQARRRITKIEIENETDRWVDDIKVGVEIANSSFVQMYKQIFWKFWEIAESYIDEGKRIEATKKRNET